MFHIRFAKLCTQNVPHKVCQTVYTECSTYGVPNCAHRMFHIRCAKCVYRMFHIRCAKLRMQNITHKMCQTVYTECST